MRNFFEFTDAELLDADTAIEVMEQLAMELQKMDGENRKNLVLCFKKISAEYEDERKVEFVEKLAKSFGLE